MVEQGREFVESKGAPFNHEIKEEGSELEESNHKPAPPKNFNFQLTTMAKAVSPPR